MITRESMEGCLLGMAIGDSVCLPREGLAPTRAARRFGAEPRQCLLGPWGLVSDDTEHACMTAQALAGSGVADVSRFDSRLGWKLRWWFAALPPGVGLATARSCIRLWLGWSPAGSGVYSAGNGPLMRAPILGLALAGDEVRLREFVTASTRLTHTDPKATHAAIAVALAARYAAQTPPDSWSTEAALAEVSRAFPPADPDAAHWMGWLPKAIHEQWPPAQFLQALHAPEGPSGYVHQTLPAVLYAWLRSPRNYHDMLHLICQLGGDADTTGAIAGGLVGAAVGPSGIPSDWIHNLKEWPRSTGWIRRVAANLHDVLNGAPSREVPLAWPAIPLRNIVLLVVALLHGLRRLIPI